MPKKNKTFKIGDVLVNVGGYFNLGKRCTVLAIALILMAVYAILAWPVGTAIVLMIVVLILAIKFDIINHGGL